jgi:tRNA-dihydrouridine synthase
MTRIDSLAKGNQSSWRRIRVDPNVPTSVQLLLNNQESTKTFIQRWKDGGYFTHEFNFNLGCPSKHIVDRGLGCAYMKRIGALNAHLQLFRDAFPGTPLSIKSRLGMNAEEKSRSQYTFMIANTNADYYIVHARHGRQQVRSHVLHPASAYWVSLFILHHYSC